MAACNIYIQGKDNGIIGSYITEKGREVEGIMLKNVIDQYEESCNEIHLYINSVGGDVDEGQKIFDFIKGTGKKIVSIVDGVCYSIATILLLLADEKNRFITDGSLIMIHLPFLSGLDCNDSGTCNADYLEEASMYVREKENQLLDVYEQTISKVNRDSLKEMMNQETFIDGIKAIELGFVSGFWANGKKQASDKIKAVANWNEKFKINNYISMTEKDELKDVLAKQESFFQKTIADLKKQIFGVFKKVKNMFELALEDGTKINIDSEDGEFAGKKVMKADSGEPLDAGTYILSDGRSLIVDGESTVTSVQLSEGEVNSEMKALQDKLAAMEAEMSAMKTKSEMPSEADMMDEGVENKSVENKSMEDETVKNLLSQISELTSVVKNLAEIQEASEGTDNPKFQTKNYKTQMTNAQSKLKNYANYIAKKFDVREYATNELVPAVKNLSVVEPNLDYTYNGQETLEILIKPTIETPDFMRLFNLVQGVRSKKQLFVTTTLRNIIKAAQNCNPTPVGANVDIDNRELVVSELGFELEQCANVFDQTIFEEWLRLLSIQKNDLSGTEVESLLRTLVGEAMKYDFWNIFSFGDVTSPSDKYDQLDGLWTKLLSGANEANNDPNGGYNYCTQRLSDITSLTESAGTTAYDYFREVFENSTVLLRGEISKDTRNAGFFVTPNVYYNYQAYLETRTGVEGAWIILQDGVKQLAFRGIPVYNVPSWEASLADVDNPLNGQYDTLILLTHVKNHYVGVQEPRDFGQFDLWYDRNADVTRMRLKAKLGYEYAHCDLQTIKVGLVN